MNGPDLVPWFVEDEMRRLGGHYSRAADWSAHVVVDGNLITGQNPASSIGLCPEGSERPGSERSARNG